MNHHMTSAWLAVLLACGGCKCPVYDGTMPISESHRPRHESRMFRLAAGPEDLQTGKVNVWIHGAVGNDGFMTLLTNRLAFSAANLSDSDVILIVDPMFVQVDWTMLSTETQTYSQSAETCFPLNSCGPHECVLLEHAVARQCNNVYSSGLRVPSTDAFLSAYVPVPGDDTTLPRPADLRSGRLRVFFSLRYLIRGCERIRTEHLEATIAVPSVFSVQPNDALLQ